MYRIHSSTIFIRDVKTLKKRGKNLGKLKVVLEKIALGLKLDSRYRDHKLSGNWGNFRECHIEPDWLLIYRINDNTLELVRTGTHSDLF